MAEIWRKDLPKAFLSFFLNPKMLGKALERRWEGLGNLWKSLEIFGNLWKGFGKALERPNLRISKISFSNPKADPTFNKPTLRHCLLGECMVEAVPLPLQAHCKYQ